MPLVRRPVPRRALLAATLGALYGLLILPAPGNVLGVSLEGVAWFFLSLSLLFVAPIAFHVYSAWGILWVLFRGVLIGHQQGNWGLYAVDAALPLASLLLLMTSSYLDVARAARGAPADEA